MTFDPECRVFFDTNFLIDLLEGSDERSCMTIIQQMGQLSESQTMIPLTCNVAIWEAFHVRKQERYMEHAVTGLQWTYRRAARGCREYTEITAAEMRRIGAQVEQDLAEVLPSMEIWPPPEASREEARAHAITNLLIRDLKLDWPDAAIFAHALAANCDLFVTNDGQLQDEARNQELRDAPNELDELLPARPCTELVGSTTLAETGVKARYVNVLTAKNKNLFISRVTNFFQNSLVAQFRPRIAFGTEDYLHFVWNDGIVSVPANEIRVDGKPSDRATPGTEATVLTDIRVPKGAYVYINELPGQ